MPAPASSSELLELVRKSGLVEEKRLEAYLQKLQGAGPLPEEPGQLAGLLVRDGLLTQFQAEQLLQGRWRRFTLGKYKVLEKLGSGGMGQVYLCEHMLMRRRVAVKVLPTAKANDEAALQRFYREARAAAALDHPNIVHAYDVDQDESLHFLVMEYVDGISLQELVKRIGPLPPLRAAHYIRQAAQGLDHAHRAGLVHRDIKPGNLLLDRAGTIKILDMGLARFFHDEDDALTRKFEESVLGTADYLAPEQAVDSHSVDIRADIYSLGATFYFLLTGKAPFEGGNVAQKLIWHQTRQPRPIREFRSDVPEEIQAIIDKMMAKIPAQRYQTPAEVIAALTPWTQTPIPPPAEHELPNLSPAARGQGPPLEPTVITPPGGPASPLPPKNWQIAASVSEKPPSGAGGGPATAGTSSVAVFSPAAASPRPAAAASPGPAPLAPAAASPPVGTPGAAGASSASAAPPAPAAGAASGPRSPVPAPVKPRTGARAVTAPPASTAPSPASSGAVPRITSGATSPAQPTPPPVALTPTAAAPAADARAAESPAEPPAAPPEAEAAWQPLPPVLPAAEALLRDDTAPAVSAQTTRTHRPGRRTRPSRRVWVLSAAAVGLFSALTTLLVYFLLRKPPAPPPAPVERPPLSVSRLPNRPAGVFASVQEALRKARIGDVIQILDDRLEENLIVDPHHGKTEVTLRAAPGQKVLWTCAKGRERDPLLLLSGAASFHLIGEGITLDGQNLQKRLLVLNGHCPGLTVEGLQLRGFTQMGIEINHCQGEPGRPVRLRHLQIESEPREPPRAGLYFAFRKDSFLPCSDFVQIEACEFGKLPPPQAIQRQAPAAVGKNVQLPPGYSW